ncbi:hypothetical protein C8R45DRAFT_944292 [Mycena sanguinolenta]|nr:hypothetical protein C8R45DRAFT_944292 [Mycena sanguinolenta]
MVQASTSDALSRRKTLDFYVAEDVSLWVSVLDAIRRHMYTRPRSLNRKRVNVALFPARDWPETSFVERRIRDTARDRVVLGKNKPRWLSGRQHLSGVERMYIRSPAATIRRSSVFVANHRSVYGILLDKASTVPQFYVLTGRKNGYAPVPSSQFFSRVLTV